MSADDLGRIMNVKMIRGSRELAGREVKLGELEALVRACVDDTSPAGARDAVILGLLYICGLRRMEVAALDTEMYNADDGIIRVIGKGNKERLVYPDTGTQAALADWFGFNPFIADAFKKTDNGRGGASCQKEEITRQSLNVKRLPWLISQA